jgi:precorrin-6A synthase
MRELLVIGIGPGHPDQITVQAVQALNRVDVFFRIDKGEVKSGLNEVRDEILRRHVVQPDYRVVSIPEPERDRSPSLSSSGYQGSVRDWHEARAELLEEAIADSLPDPGSGVGAFLVWGDQSLYDSTLRIIEKILDRGVVSFACTVIPGVTSVQALAAAHRIPLNRVGEPVHITPARRIAGGLPAGIDNAVVMLDSGFTAAGFADPSLEVYWGAYLGTPDETLVAGRLADVADEITNTRAELRTRHGWIMDTYLLRREQGGAEKNGLPARAVERLRGRRGRPGRRADRSPVRRGVHQERCSCPVAQPDRARRADTGAVHHSRRHRGPARSAAARAGAGRGTPGRGGGQRDGSPRPRPAGRTRPGKQSRPLHRTGVP